MTSAMMMDRSTMAGMGEHADGLAGDGDGSEHGDGPALCDEGGKCAGGMKITCSCDDPAACT